MLPQMSLAVVGADFPNKRGPGRRFEIALCAPGDMLELRPEPKNPADEHAIAVCSERDVQIGYISSQRAVYLAKLLREGHSTTAIFQDRTSFGAVARVAFDDDAPVLPVPTTRRPADMDGVDPDPDWQPDQEWSEE